jgi:TonB family protein
MRILIAALAQLFFISTSLIAQQFVTPPPWELGKWWNNSEVVRQLQLSVSQVDQIETIFMDHRMPLADLNSQLKIHEEDLKKQMLGDPINEAAVRALTEHVAVTRTALERVNSSMMLSIRKALSKEQWEKLEEIRNPRAYTTDEGLKLPKVIYQRVPPYTQEARSNRIEGVVFLQVVVRKNGTVDSAKVLKGLGYGLDEQAIEIVTREWRFEPGTKNGVPVDVQMNIVLTFRLY